MNILPRRILHTSLIVILTSLLLHGCGRPYRRPPPAESPRPGQERTLRPGPQQQEEAIEETPALPGREIKPEREEGIVPDLKPQKGPAHSLYRDAEQAMKNGQYKQAEILLERALRVEPKNGWYWHAMGRVQYEQGSYEQAIQFCRKSDSMAGQDSELKRNNQLLLKKASSKTGDIHDK